MQSLTTHKRPSQECIAGTREKCEHWEAGSWKGVFETGSNIHKADSRFPGGQASGEFLGTQTTIVLFPESEDVNLGEL